MELYRIEKEYYNSLKEVDNKVPMLEEEKQIRPFIGFILKVNDKNYFAPLTSPKEKHQSMKNKIDFIKIEEGMLGAINLNNMLPIPISRCIPISFMEIEDEKYRILMEKQWKWCKKHELEIIAKAHKLYDCVCYTPKEEYVTLKNRCCNFKKLEESCYLFMRQNHIREEEFCEYQYEI